MRWSRSAPDFVYYLLNKPDGVITTADDPQGRPTVMTLVPAEPRVFPVGRLDRQTEGLLILTNDGALAQLLTHPSHGVAKEYVAEVAGDAGARRPAHPAPAAWSSTTASLRRRRSACWRRASCASSSTRAATARCGACATPSAIPCGASCGPASVPCATPPCPRDAGAPCVPTRSALAASAGTVAAGAAGLGDLGAGGPASPAGPARASEGAEADR